MTKWLNILLFGWKEEKINIHSKHMFRRFLEKRQDAANDGCLWEGKQVICGDGIHLPHLPICAVGLYTCEYNSCLSIAVLGFQRVNSYYPRAASKQAPTKNDQILDSDELLNLCFS